MKRRPQKLTDKGRAILAMVEQIPAGKVATYGQIAALAGLPKNARQVGAVLRDLPSGSAVPWFRVLNSKGEISPGKGTRCTQRQKRFLEAEGVVFSGPRKIAIKDYAWDPSQD
jgi:methylated-DNA-protein-cysteine methyltransferase-like protein